VEEKERFVKREQRRRRPQETAPMSGAAGTDLRHLPSSACMCAWPMVTRPVLMHCGLERGAFVREAE